MGVLKCQKNNFEKRFNNFVESFERLKKIFLIKVAKKVKKVLLSHFLSFHCMCESFERYMLKYVKNICAQNMCTVITHALDKF